MKLIAHRGIHDEKIKENTYKSIYKALTDDRYIGVEFDVRVTRDNEFVIYHDAMYDGRLIKNINYVELPKYIPKLSNILKIKSDKIFLIEIKNIEGNINKFIKLLSKYKDKNIYVTSFNGKLMEKICKMAPTFKTGVLNYILNSTEMNCLDFICILDTLLDDKIINTLIKNGKEIFSYGIINNKKIGLYDDVNYIVD